MNSNGFYCQTSCLDCVASFIASHSSNSFALQAFEWSLNSRCLSLVLLRFSVEIGFLCACVRGQEGWGLLQGLAFLHLDALQTVFCSSLCLCVGHSKYVVSFNTLVVATVSWDGVTKIQSALFYVHSIKEAGGILSRLVILGLLILSTLLHKSSSGIINVTRFLNTVELVDSWGCNRLNWIWQLQNNLNFEALLFNKCSFLCELQLIVQQFHGCFARGQHIQT